MKKEIEFLQGAFESYKSSLHQETEEKWKRKEEDLKNDLETQKNKELQEMSKHVFYWFGFKSNCY
jgi:hypothetical protein